MDSGGTESDVVLGEADPGNPIGDIGFVLLDPTQLGGGEAGQGGFAGVPDQRLSAKPFVDLLALLDCSLVVPENGRSEDMAGFIVEHEAMHLAGEGDGVDRVRRRKSLDEPANGRGCCVPPGIGILFRPMWMRCVGRP